MHHTANASEKRVAKELALLLGERDTFLEDFRRANDLFGSSKKVAKPLEGLAECKNIFKEPKVVKAKKVYKSLDGLAGCKNIFKEPKVAKAGKVSKSLEGLAGCNLFNRPYKKASTTNHSWHGTHTRFL